MRDLFRPILVALIGIIILAIASDAGYRRVLPVISVLTFVAVYLVIRISQRSQGSARQIQESHVVQFGRHLSLQIPASNVIRFGKSMRTVGAAIVCSSALGLYAQWDEPGYPWRLHFVIGLCIGVILFRKGRGLLREHRSADGGSK